MTRFSETLETPETSETPETDETLETPETVFVQSPRFSVQQRQAEACTLNSDSLKSQRSSRTGRLWQWELLTKGKRRTMANGAICAICAICEEWNDLRDLIAFVINGMPGMIGKAMTRSDIPKIGVML